MMPPLRIAQTKVALVDPHDCTDASDVLTLLQALCDSLVRRHGAGFAPRLAQSWTVSDDACHFTFVLRPGLVFHDGSPLTAEDVCANLRRMARPDKGYTLGAPGVWHQFLGDAIIEATDARTLTIALSRPIADLLDILAQGFIVAPSCLPRLDAGHLDALIGSGPYRLSDQTADHVTAIAHDGHFAGPPPHPIVEWTAVPDPATRLALLQDGKVDVASRVSGTAKPTQVILTNHVDPVAIIYLFNTARGPLASADLRRALHLAVDRPALIRNVLGGAAVPLHGFVSDVHFGAVPGTPAPYDPETARALLAKAGYGGGLTLKVDCPTRLPDEAVALTGVLAEQLAKVGVTLDVTYHEDREAYAHMVRRKEIGDMCVFDSSPMSTFRVIYEKLDARVAGSWWQGYHNPAVEACLDEARGTTDDAARAVIYQRAYAALQEDPPWLYLYNPVRTIGLAPALAGFTMAPDGVLDVTALPSPEASP
ncbi:MAG: ABC transporter substrate-binding protein [Flavimaricola sp.]|nr:ABC transporter substrate-binding protein [Flavimaricola sp.]